MKVPNIRQILILLEQQYGAFDLVPNQDPLAELVKTILSQNTSDSNSRPAFKALAAAFGNWDEVMNADTQTIAHTIKSAGLGQIKANRIQQALREIKLRRGTLQLDFLAGMPVPEARDWLKKLPGVGNKTANCVLLFALGKPALPVDTHIFRVAKRLKLIQEKASLDEAHQILECMIDPAVYYRFHVLIIEHGRKICIARHPRCSRCVLQNICPSYKILNDQPHEI
jgi:endonuclease III